MSGPDQTRLTGESPAVARARRADVCSEMRRGNVIWLAYASAGRYLIRLLKPALIVFLPIGLLAMAALGFVVDSSTVAVVNGDLALIGAPGTPLLVWSAAVLVASVAGQLVAVPATVVLAVGHLVGKPVSTAEALRAAVRRWLPMLGLLVLVGVIVIAVAVPVGFVTLAVTETEAMVYVAMVALALLVMPCLLAVPGVVLENRSATDALARAYRLTGDAFSATTFTLMFGVVLFPTLAIQAPHWATGLAPVAALAVVPFQATVIARLFLHRAASEVTSAEFEEFVDGLPESEPRPVRPLPVLAGLLLPGLLYGSAVLANPLGLLEVSETVITEDGPLSTRDETPEHGRRSDLTFDWSELQALYAGQGGRIIMLMDDASTEAKLLTCADSRCAEPRLTWAEPPVVAGEYTSVGARLADGRLAVTTWAIDDMYRWVWDENWSARLGLVLCDAEACVPATGEPLAEVTEAARGRVLAMAGRPGGGVLIAQLHPISWGEDTYKEVLSVTACDDLRCTRRHTREVTKFTVNPDTERMRELVVGVDADDRPVVLGFDRDSGSMVVISCQDPTCTFKNIERPVQAESFGHNSDPSARAAMAIRADGRPLIAYQAIGDGAIKLLDCRNRACSKADTTTLTEPGQFPSGLALGLGWDGRAWVAFQDPDRQQIFIAACTGTRCTRTPVTGIPRGGGHGLTMALDGRGRPTLAWIDSTGEDDFPDKDDWALVVTTPLTLPAE